MWSILPFLAAIHLATAAVVRRSVNATASSASGNSVSACKIFTSGAAVPSPAVGINLLEVGTGDAPYDTSLSDLLAGISFPNGYQCRRNLVILFPGTAVPALDTYTSTMIPVFASASNGDADVLVMTNPSVSLGDVQITAEYAAFAINYAALVLGKRATMIAWSQGNLNTQWALKYWPSTRKNLKNYVALSPDYDGTVEASFLCDPEKLLTSSASTLIKEYLTNDGLGTDLQSILGIGALPTSADQFQYYLLALLEGNVTTTASTTKSGISSSASLDISLNLRDARPNKRAVPFGMDSIQQIEARTLEQEIKLRARRSLESSPSALVQLVEGLAGPISEALTSLAVQPESVLNEVLSNVVGNLGNLQIPTTLPQGCLASVWQQVYQSDLVNILATNYGNGAGNTAFVPSTTVFSITDEIVEPQGVTGFENASGYLLGSMASNILIQGNGGCSDVASTLVSGLPDVITHEGVLYSGMGVAVAVAAVTGGSTVSVSQIDAKTRCDLLSPLLTAEDALAQEATIPGALARLLFGGGDQTLSTSFLSAEPAIKSYATVKH